MFRIAIRDDDMNFFTAAKEVEAVYNQVAEFGVPVSYAVVPIVTDVLGDCPETKGNTTPRWVGDNNQLVDWVKEQIKIGKAEVLMHGITHEYKFSDGRNVPEMVWRSGDVSLNDTISTWKKRLESTFEQRITVFVAPCNHISIDCLNVVVNNGMDYSGIVPLNYSRRITIRNVLSYSKRVCVRILNRIPYPGVLRYSDHLELNACALGEQSYLERIYDYSKQHQQPLVINTHYWNLRDNPSRIQLLDGFVRKCLEGGATPSTLSDCLVL